MSESAGAIIRRTALYEAHTKLGARMGEWYGWEMPASYGEARAEHRAVREAAGLIDLSSHGAIMVGGKEGAQFLHGLVTNDVKGLAAGQGMRAAFLTGHGKIKALCRIFGFGEGRYLILTDAQTHEAIFKYVFPFTYAGDFEAEDVSERYRLLSVQGPNSEAVMKEVCFEPLPPLAEHGWTETTMAGHRVIAVRASHTGEKGIDLLVPEAALVDVWDFLLLKGIFHGLAPVGQEALECLRIEAGIPVYGVDIDERNMMLESGLADAVSYTKGCYTGQEAVAMATYRGHVSKRLSFLIVKGDAAPAPQAKVFREGKEVGEITSVTESPEFQSTVALALIKYGHFEPGTELEIETPSGGVPAVVQESGYRAA